MLPTDQSLRYVFRVREEFLYVFLLIFGELCPSAELALHIWRHPLVDVAGAGLRAQDLAGTGDLEATRRRLVCLHLRHSVLQPKCGLAPAFTIQPFPVGTTSDVARSDARLLLLIRCSRHARPTAPTVRKWRENHDNTLPFRVGRSFYGCAIFQIVAEPRDQVHCRMLVLYLPAAQDDQNLNLVSMIQEGSTLAEFDPSSKSAI